MNSPPERLNNLLPEGAVAGGDERILAGVPAKEMGRVGVLGVRFAAGPHFVEQKRAGSIHGAVQIESETAVFFARVSTQGAEFRFQYGFLTLARP